MTAADKIKQRIMFLERVHASYISYQQFRVDERDHHGAWDAAVNLSETECEIQGLRFALDCIEEEITSAAANRTSPLPFRIGEG